MSLGLLILAVIAGFLFYNLRSVLGQTPYDPKERHRHKPNRSPQSEELNGTQYPSKIQEPIAFLINHRYLDGDSAHKKFLTQSLNTIHERYAEFNLDKFIEGTYGAYEMIINNFSNNSLDRVKDFVSKDILEEFQQLRDSYDDKAYEFTNIVTQIESVIVKDVQLDSKTAYITTVITSKNIVCLKDDNQNIISGDPKKIQKVVDSWVFKRDFHSNSPAWILDQKE